MNLLETVVFLAVFVALFWYPGRMAVWVLRLEHARFLFAVAASYAISLAVLLCARYAGMPVLSYMAAVVLAGTALGGLGWFLRRDPGRGDVTARTETLLRWPAIRWQQRSDFLWLVPGLLTLVLMGYLVRLGPYAEIPADAWWHLGQIQDVLETLVDGRFDRESGAGDLYKMNGTHWYFFPAVAVQQSGQDLVAALPLLAAANTVLLLAMVYSFALFVFRNVSASRAYRHAVAAASVYFFVLHFGISVFSFVRYYTFAPVLLNLGVYFAAVVLVEQMIENARSGVAGVVLLLALMATMALVHRQELMYITIMAFSMLAVAAWRENAGALASWWRGGRLPDLGRRSLRLGLIALAAICAAAVVWLLLYLGAHRSNPLVNHRLIPVGNLLPFIKNLYILDPTYQFYQVVTVWGVLVFVLYFSGYKRFQGSVYLRAGMLLPLLTVFNPLFIDMFLRIYYSELVWRLCFMLPLSFVGGHLFVSAVTGLGGTAGWRHKGRDGVVAVLLLMLLVPVHTRYFYEENSRLETVRAVKPENGHRLWLDMLGYLNTVESRGIITDRITGYVINGMTHHHYPGFKFFGDQAVPYNLPAYGPRSFADRDGWLIVVNRRDGGYSRVGALSRHWSPREMEVSRHYSDELLNYLAGNPEHFPKLWEQDRIVIYRVRYGQAGGQ